MFKEPIKAALQFQESKEVTTLNDDSKPAEQIQMHTNSQEQKENFCTN